MSKPRGTSEKPRFSRVSSDFIPISPPRDLGEPGQNLWDALQREFRIEDRGGVELLAAACEALDRAQALREAIKRDGEMLYSGRSGAPRPHPGIKLELELRAFVVKTLEKLGVTLEPLKATVGRPGSAIGWTGE
jgi:hypothetical protein